MALSVDLISQFAKLTNNADTKSASSTAYGTVAIRDGSTYVILDGSDLLTPVSTVTDINDGERVTVTIKNHTVTITGNLSSPAARTDDVKEVKSQVETFNTIVAEKATIKDLEAVQASIDTLEADNATIKETLTANAASIDTLEADNATIKETLIANAASIDTLEADNVTIKETLTANTADIDTLEADNVTIKETLTANTADIDTLEADNVTIKETLTANTADIDTLEADNVTIKETLIANAADIKTLQADKLSATDAALKYANIDFSNIGEAAMQYFYAQSGLIKDVVVGDQTITGELVGVTISGDLVKANTLVAEKLVIKGEDGLYYKLNTDGITTGAEEEQTDYNSLNGQVIRAKSITATQISVTDLVAFGATIGGFTITDGSLYSGVKESASNTTRGAYLGSDGQVAFGDADNFIKYYKDDDGNYHLAISAESLTFTTSGKNVEEEIESIRDEVTVHLYIGSSKGTVFKNDNVSTTLIVTIYRGTDCITDMATLKEKMGDGVSLQWSFLRPGEDTYYQIDAGDSRIGDDGFTFSISPDDVDASATFVCELIEEEGE